MQKIAIQGLKGSYSHKAVLDFSKKIKNNFELIESETFEKLFFNIEKYGLGLVPVENSITGSVAESFYNFWQKEKFEVIAETNLPIKHCLLAKEKIEIFQIQKVVSHYQSLKQCSEFLSKHKLNFEPLYDNSYSAKFVKENKNKNVASIGAEILKDIYELEIIEKNISNNKNNTTKFFFTKNETLKFDIVFKKIKQVKSCILFDLKNIQGILCKVLKVFANNNIDLSKIESRPNHIKNFEYFFIIEFIGHINDDNIQKTLQELKKLTRKIVILGTYQNV